MVQRYDVSKMISSRHEVSTQSHPIDPELCAGYPTRLRWGVLAFQLRLKFSLAIKKSTKDQREEVINKNTHGSKTGTSASIVVVVQLTGMDEN